MKEYIQLLWKNHRKSIVSNSITNCHVRGLHSIMLLDVPEKRIRLYYLEPGSEISNLDPIDIVNGDKPLNLAFHPHHCELGLKMVKGKLINWTIQETDRVGGSYFNKYEYRSQITHGEIEFKLIQKYVKVTTLDFNYMSSDSNSYIFMDANKIHTVFTQDQKEPVAWLVFEGKEDPNYQSVCYSNKPLDNNEKDPVLYLPMFENEVLRILMDCNLI